MKYILVVSAILFTSCLFAQDNMIAEVDIVNNAAITGYPIDKVDSADEILLGEFNDKPNKGKELGKGAYYFANTIGEGAYLNAFLFKVDRARYQTKLYVRFYEKKEFIQDIYADNDTVSYPSFIPGKQIETDEIIINVEPQQKGLVEVDLSEYNIIMPRNGLFVSLEPMGYFDEKGNAAKNIKFRELIKIDFHPSTSENYCAWAEVQGRKDSGFWINSNKAIKADFTYSFKKEPSKSILVAPNFGLKVARR